MTLEDRIDLLAKLGKHIAEKGDYLEAILHRTEYNNAWFTKAFQHQALDWIAQHWLQKNVLSDWATHYSIPPQNESKNIGLITESSIPMASFHDIISIFLLGFHAQIILSEENKFTLQYFAKWLGEQEPNCKKYFSIVDKVKGFDAIIVNSDKKKNAFYQTYFGKFPNLIRQKKYACGILQGNESETDILKLGKDIFDYFGLGSRNVSKIYVPNNYDFDFFLKTLHEGFKRIVLHSKYKNNFDYNYSIFMLNKMPFLSNGCLLLIENEALASRIATLHYETYKDENELIAKIKAQETETEIIVSNKAIENLDVVAFGQSQKPPLLEYKKGNQTLNFLLSLVKN